MNNPVKITREEVRLKVLGLLDLEPALSQRDISCRLGVSLGSVNYCLKALVEKGWIKVNNFRRSDNKLAYAYILTPYGVTEKTLLTKRFLQRKVIEYESLKSEIAKLKAQIGESDIF
tara:strand:+ start:327 stop:677 length:351 start_codon:yes stop_codon:yes gene_type:complete